MNKREFIEFKLEENVNKCKDLKEKHNLKRDEYLKTKEEFDNSDIKKEIEDKKNSLLTLQEKHKKELDELKKRHESEREKMLSEYISVRDKQKLTMGAIKDELGELSKQLSDANIENKTLKKELKKCVEYEDVKVTSHAVVQYLNRAKNLDIEKIKAKVRENLINSGDEINSKTQIQDHQVVEYLTGEGLINLSEVENEIMPESVKELIMKDELLGSTGVFPTKGGFRLAVSGGKVVTFLPRKEKITKKKVSLFKKESRAPKKMKL
jgi:hypothetical protein